MKKEHLRPLIEPDHFRGDFGFYYCPIFRHQMDHGTIMKMLETSSSNYFFQNTAEDVLQNAQVVWDNCKTFHGKCEHFTHHIGRRLQRDVLGLRKWWSLDWKSGATFTALHGHMKALCRVKVISYASRKIRYIVDFVDDKIDVKKETFGFNLKYPVYRICSKTDFRTWWPWCHSLVRQFQEMHLRMYMYMNIFGVYFPPCYFPLD